MKRPFTPSPLKGEGWGGGDAVYGLVSESWSVLP